MDDAWSPTSFSLPLGIEANYLGTTARLQSQLPLTAGWATTATSVAETRLDDHSESRQVFTGTAPHTVVLPPTVTSTVPITIYNQSTGSLTVLAADTTAVQNLTGQSTSVYTPSGLTPVSASAWTVSPATDRAPEPRSGFPYLTTVVEDGAWRTSWGVVEV